MTKRSRRNADIMILVSIFGVVLLYIADYLISTYGTPSRMPKWGTVHLHLIRDCVFECFVWAFFFGNALRYKACIFSWIAVVSYLLLILLQLSYYLFLFPYSVLLNVGTFILFVGMAGMFIFYILRLCFLRLGKSSFWGLLRPPSDG